MVSRKPGLKKQHFKGNIIHSLIFEKVYCQICQQKQQQFNSKKMDYEALGQLLPLPPHCWNSSHVEQWLQFVHLHNLTPSFNKQHINGTALLSLNEQKLEALGVSNNIIKRKIIRWVKEGFPQFEQHILSKAFDNKENIPPLQRKETTDRGMHKIKPSQNFRPHPDQQSMIIRSCDGSLSAFYVMKERVLKIGRSPSNIIRSLEVSVEPEHAQIVRIKGKHYLIDKGTESGTFIKIIHPRALRVGSLVEIGSFIMEVKQINRQIKAIQLRITHMISLGSCEVTISLVDGCSFYSFGRRKTNNFYADDEHLSGIHAKIFLQQGEFFIEDMHSTNGTWLRLNHPRVLSEPFLLEEGAIFKIGTTITYQCMAPDVKEQKMEIEYVDSCVGCSKEQRNILFLPCKHNAVCSDCAESLEQCPLCEGEISQRIKIYI